VTRHPFGARGAAVATTLALALASTLALLVLLAPGAAAAATPAAPATPKPPALLARAAVLVQPDTADVVYRRAASAQRPIASTTKLMTALITLEHADLDKVVTAIPYAAAPAESLMGLKAGDRVSIRDLLRGLLLPSGNDAAATLAVRVAGSRARFVRWMNKRAGELGLEGTHYSNPVGLDDAGNHSSAIDLAELALVLLKNPFFAATVDSKHLTVTMGGRRRTLTNRNTLLQDGSWIDGVKTGHTSQAGYVLVGAAKRRGVRLISVVLADPSEAARDSDSLALLRWGMRLFRSSAPVKKGQVLARPKLAFRDEHAELVAAAGTRVVVRRGEPARVRVVGVPDEIDGPVAAGTRLGTAIVTRDGREVARVPIVTRTPIAAVTFGDRVSTSLPIVLVVGAAAVLVACSLLLVLRRRRRIRRRQARSRGRGGTETA
jgi:serine-type D-Ala-D-Ala carboxypeptidase (penicillin-binding protein 5/6)